MAINGYIGLMGSGKSFEVVNNVILPAYKAGRTIVTNIEGLNEEEIKKYLRKPKAFSLIEKLILKIARKEPKEVDETQWGSVKIVTDDECKKARFFPTDSNSSATCPNGSLVVIDEAWKIWGNDKEPLPEHLEFFTKHRHYVDEKTKSTCDLVVCVQDLGLIHRKLKVLIEQTSKTTKFKFLGAPKKYRVDIYQGSKQTKASLISQFYRSYDKDIFPLYHSYSGGQGNENVVDKRINLFRNPWFIGYGIASILLVAFGLKYTVGFFNPDNHKTKEQIAKEKKEPKHQSSASASPTEAAPQNINASAQSSSVDGFSTDMRLLGVMNLGDRAYAIVEKNGRERPIPLNQCQNKGFELVCDIDNQKISLYSGTKGVSNGKIL